MQRRNYTLCIMVFIRLIKSQAANLATAQTETVFPVINHTELPGSYALNGIVGINQPCPVIASSKLSMEKFRSMPYLEAYFHRHHILLPRIVGYKPEVLHT